MLAAHEERFGRIYSVYVERLPAITPSCCAAARSARPRA
jgi:hypothetical protein